jgi:cobalt/nickel transport system permease protein
MAPGLTDRLALAGYAAAVVSASLVHRPGALAAALALAILLAGPARWRLLRRTLLAVLAFNLSVSLGYTLVAGLRGEFQTDYLLLVNLRVLLMVFLGFWLVSRIQLAAALDFAPTLAFLITLAAGQARALQRFVTDFRQAIASRTPHPPGIATAARQAVALAPHLLDQSLATAQEITLAMRSRGCFDGDGKPEPLSPATAALPSPQRP